MKRSIFLLSVLLCGSAHIFAQEPYSIPFQEPFAGTSTENVYDNETLNALTSTKGWQIAESITRFSPSATPAPTLNGISFKTYGEGGYLLTPQINVPQGTALEINFMGRPNLNDIGANDTEKAANNLQRNFYVVIGEDTIYDHHKLSYDIAKPLFQNPNRWMGSIIYEGTSPIRLKFFSTNTYQGVWSGLQDGIIIQSNSGISNNTGMLIRQTDTVPALNIAYGQNKNLGTINLTDNPANTTVSKTFSLKGVNLVGDVVLSDATATNISLPVKTITPVSGSVNENVTVNIRVPATPGTYKEKVTVVADGDRANNTTNTLKSPIRTIWFTYNVVSPTGLNDIENQTIVFASGKSIQLRSTAFANAEVYNLSGILLAKKTGVQNASFEVPSGIYIVKAGNQVSKVVL
jgi:hypothetical protein